jgi:hypothetical protein
VSFSWLKRTDLIRGGRFALLLGLALAARVHGLGFGLPLWSNFYIRPDETLLVVPAAELFARAGDPGHLCYPALMITLLAGLFHACHAVWPGAEPSLLADFSADPSRYFLIARAFSAACGTALTLLVYRLARAWTKPAPAWVAALWYAVSPLAAREAHFAVTDTLMSLLVTASVCTALRWLAEPDRARHALRCGALVGLATATKYNAGLLAPALAGIALVLPAAHQPRRRGRTVLIFLTSSAVVFLALNPYLVMRVPVFIDWLRVLAHDFYGDRTDLATMVEVGTRLSPGIDLLSFTPGSWVGLATAATGVFVALARHGRERTTWILLGVTAAWAALLIPTSILPFRYLSPLLPLIAVLSAIGLHALARPGLILPAALAGLALTGPATLRMNRSLARTDTRSEAGQWIHHHVPATEPVIWLGEPEAEPQVQESAASLARRRHYAEQRYGLENARVINRIYQLMAQAPAAHAPTAHEVYRNPPATVITNRRVWVVHAEYPLPMIRTDAARLAAWTQGHELQRVVFGAVPDGQPRLDPVDAFFLPLPPPRTLAPGPRLTIRHIERAAP